MKGHNGPIAARITMLAFAMLALGLLVFAGVAAAGVPTKDAGSKNSANLVTPSPTPNGCTRAWEIYPMNVMTNAYSELLGGDATGPNDIWAVGSEGLSGLVEHWNGSAWTPMTGTGVLTNSRFFDVAAVAPNNVWVVGRDYSNTGVSQPYIIRWDGSTWSGTEYPVNGGAALFGIDALSPTDIWAVGGYWAGGALITMHWDGNSWTNIPAPIPGNGAGLLYTVDARASNDVWAVGGLINNQSLAMHWDGTAWSLVPTPYSVFLNGVAVLSPTDVWAVGFNNSGQSKILHWNGTSWTVSLDVGYQYLDLVAFAPDDIWAAGRSAGTGVSHWDGSSWQTINSPGPYPGGGDVYAIVALSPTDIWFMGSRLAFNPDHTEALAMHYGTWCPTPIVCQTGWNLIDHANPDPVANILNAVDGVAPDDLWAVGTASTGTQIQHWNGSYWAVVPSLVQPTPVALRDVTAVSSNDVWAVGSYSANSSQSPDQGVAELAKLKATPDSTSRSVILHWDGTAWAQVPVPDLSSNLMHLSVVSANDIWAVGNYYAPDNVSRALILHWNGSTWTVASPGNTDGVLYGVDAVSANDVWAVGSTSTGTNGLALTMHWDGTQWTTVSNPGITGTLLYDVTSLGPNDTWAVGVFNSHPLALHWSGSAWGVVAVPGTGRLVSISAVSSTEIWALGTYGTDHVNILRWDGSLWQVAAGSTPYADLYDIFAPSSNEVWYVGLFSGDYRILSAIGRYVVSCQVPPPTPTPPPCTTGWSIINSPNPTLGYNYLYDVTASSNGDMWAVGSSGAEALTMRWNDNAAQWDTVLISNTSSLSQLMGIDIISPNNVWSVGSTIPSERGASGPTGKYASPDWYSYALALNWDGQQWNSVSTGITTSATLLDVKGISANDVWAVGADTRDVTKPLMIHWNGSIWTRYPAPAGNGILYGVEVLSANDAWAVGSTSSHTESPDASLILHWDGASWSNVPAPSPGTYYTNYTDIEAISANDIWAVGYYVNINGGSSDSLVIHWDGSTWTSVTVPSNGWLLSLDVLSSNDIWAIGQGGPANPSALHWNGSQWTQVPLLSPESGTLMWGIAARSSNEIWSVGDIHDNPISTTLTERYRGSCQTPSPTSTANTATPTSTSIPTNTSLPTNTPTIPPTQTPGGSTATPIPTDTPTSTPTDTATPAPTQTPGGPTATTIPTNTDTPVVPTATSTTQPSATPVTCTIQFADIPTNHTFYTYIRCLACEGVISGYACGSPGEPCNPTSDPYFRPNNGVTRGQLAKIVSEAAGFNDIVTGQTFEDVPEGSTFYLYVERLASRGVMQGYACGGAGEPCGTGNRQYFRPNAGATRGQISKIVSNAMQWSDTIPAGQYTFADVQEGSTFHPYVERLLMHRAGAMQGYPCGSSREPCDDQGRPYFRPSDTLTRGQTAKIVSNTVMPECVP